MTAVGITAALAPAAELGVSLTHRNTTQSVRLVTGHARNGAVPANLDWTVFAAPSATTIFYMAGRTAGEIGQHLIDGHMDPHTPVVIASNVGRADALHIKVTVAELASGAVGIDTSKPVVVAVGMALAHAAGYTDYNEVRTHNAIGNKPPIALINASGASGPP